MNNLFFSLSFILAVLLEGTITSVPLVLDVLIVFYIIKRSSKIFIPAFIAGILLDIFSVRAIGASSIFFIISIFFIFLYERKFEIVTYPFVFFSSFLGGALYLFIFGYNHIFEQALINSLFAIIIFGITKKL